MRLKVERTYRGKDYTIGHLYVDDKYFSDTLEDTDRGLAQDMTLSKIEKIKVKGDTCIPYGKYKVSLNIVSAKYSDTKKYPYAAIAKGRMPRIINVPGFEGILIHAGNTPKDTMGCLLVGENKVKGQVINSQATWKKLYLMLRLASSRGEAITIEYIKK
ncbi:MAG: hypothetical protein IJU02_07175 [Lachnospiraceae bacterium]|nr:hypothetical protein [Lachnospiraceae bacterium]